MVDVVGVVSLLFLIGMGIFIRSIDIFLIFLELKKGIKFKIIWII